MKLRPRPRIQGSFAAVMVGVAAAEGAATVMENAGSVTVELPSLTVMRMFAYVPAWATLGTPYSVPRRDPNEAHEGLFWMLNFSGRSVFRNTVGVNA